jgi:hypothetical protein
LYAAIPWQGGVLVYGRTTSQGLLAVLAF